MQHYSKEEREMWVEDWHQSGKRAWAYAKENGINPQTFINWTKSGTEAKPCFVEVPAPITKSIPQMPEILIEKGEVRIHIPLLLGTGELRAVMEGLGGTL